jgi:Zn-dependent peptidase ImmA (M78 family)
MQIGERLRLARGALGYTLDRVAAETNIGQSSLSEFENGKREPRFSQLSRLAELYRRSVEFFLREEPLVQNTMLWRDAPETQEQIKQTEAQFRQLCEQYRTIEIILNEVRETKLPAPRVRDPEDFDYAEAEFFAKQVQREFCLDDVPIASLKKKLEEVYYIKIFYLSFSGSAISTVSEQFGPAILLNSNNKQWRRSYDLAHELFHILTWHVFRPHEGVATTREERLANAFASRLLMPEESITFRIKERADANGRISFGQLDDIAREYDVSLQALIYRLASIHHLSKAETADYVSRAQKYLTCLKPRSSGQPDERPERYCSLAIRALNEGKLSLAQFARYMGLSYKKAQEYLMDEGDLTDEEVSIPVA